MGNCPIAHDLNKHRMWMQILVWFLTTCPRSTSSMNLTHWEDPDALNMFRNVRLDLALPVILLKRCTYVSLIHWCTIEWSQRGECWVCEGGSARNLAPTGFCSCTSRACQLWSSTGRNPILRIKFTGGSWALGSLEQCFPFYHGNLHTPQCYAWVLSDWHHWAIFLLFWPMTK